MSNITTESAAVEFISKRKLVPYAGKEPSKPLAAKPVSGASVVADGTVIDGIDCSGMSIDPKKDSIPVYLQTQNRRGLSPEQKAKVDALVKRVRNEAKTQATERKKRPNSWECPRPK